MSVGAVRSPTRLLGISNIGLAFPGELLIDPSTGNFTYVTDTLSQIVHKKPGTLTVTQGDRNLIDHADLSGDVSFSIPDVKMPTFTADRVLISNGTGDMAASSISTTILEYLTGVTSNIQTQLNSKSPTTHDHTGVYLPVNGTAAAASKLVAAVGITVGSSTKNFDGSAPISFSLSEIGAAAATHTHSEYLGASGGTVTGTLNISGVLNVTGTATGIQKVYSGTLSTSWSGSAAPYTQTVRVNGILSTDRPIVDYTNSGTYATDQSREEAWLNVYRGTTAANSITFYAHEKPTVAIPFTALVTR